MEGGAKEQINLSRIKQRKVIKLMKTHGLQYVRDFQLLKSLCYDPCESFTYYPHIKKFKVKDTIDNVWAHYNTISPQEAWNGKMLSFGLLYSRKKNEIIYEGDIYPGIEEGQVILINISLLGGLLNIAVAHHITEVNEAEKTIRICYIEKGASEGSQWIRFLQSDDGFTEIVHETRYRGKSTLRDTQLYPVLHEKAISEFHQNVLRRLNKRSI